MKEIRSCQSCGLPMGESVEMMGTNKDGSRNPDYCIYCYADGEFKLSLSVEQMAEINIPLVVSSGVLSEEEAREMLLADLGELKRWQEELKICL